MSRCRETAGILFKRKCVEAAAGICGHCNKPICVTHGRRYNEALACVSCLRQLIKSQGHQRHNQAHLRDDPYFYWYYVDDMWLSDDFGDDDYALFDDHGGGDWDHHDDGGWEGT